MTSAQEEYIFLQAQEMFPQVEASVVYVILSENDFKLNDVLSYLTILARSVDDAQNQYSKDINQLKPNIADVSFKQKKKIKAMNNVRANEMIMAQHSVSADKEVIPKVCDDATISSYKSTCAEETLNSSFSQAVHDHSFSKNESKTAEQCNFSEENEEKPGQYSVYFPYYGTGHDVNELLTTNALCNDFNQFGMQFEVHQPTVNDVCMLENTQNQPSFYETHPKPGNKHILKSYVQTSSYVSIGNPNGKRLVFNGCVNITPSNPLPSSGCNIEVVSKKYNKRKNLKEVDKSDLCCTEKSLTNPGFQGLTYSTIKKLDAKFESTARTLSVTDTNSLSQSTKSPLDYGILKYDCTSSRMLASLEENSACITTADICDGFKTKNINTDNSNLQSILALGHKTVSSTNSLSSSSFCAPPNTGNLEKPYFLSTSKKNVNDKDIIAATKDPTTDYDLNILNNQTNSSLDNLIENQYEQKNTSKQPYCPKASLSTDNSQINLKDTARCMYILRGLPGSGKSTLARKLCGGNGAILSSDDFFNTRKGYKFDPTQLSEAHELNQKKAKDCLRKGLSPICIDNTNTTALEMKPYITMAIQFGYKVEIMEPDTWWKFKANELAKRNIHNVPKQTIKAMLDRFERHVSIRSVVGKELFDVYQQNCLIHSLSAKKTSIDVITKEITTPNEQPSVVQVTTSSSSRPLTTIASSKPLTMIKDIAKKHHQQVGENDVQTLSTVQAMPSKKTEKLVESTTTMSTASIAENVFYTSLKSENGFINSSSNISLNSPLCSTLPETKLNSVPKCKKKPKKLAVRFSEVDLSKVVNNSSSNWNSFLNILDTTSSNKTKSPNNFTVKNSNSQTNTENVYFGILSKLDENSEFPIDDVVLTANCLRFKAAQEIAIPKKSTKLTYDKSTSTNDLTTNFDDDRAVETLTVLFPDYSEEDLTHIYLQCNKQLDWATNVIADSSLFGPPENLPISTNGEEASLAKLSLDAYYDNLSKKNSTDHQCDDEVALDEIHSQSASLNLQLPAEFVKKLVEMFGENTDDVTNCTLGVDGDLAFVLYSQWKLIEKKRKPIVTANETSHLDKMYSLAPHATGTVDITSRFDVVDQLKKDEELAREIQSQELIRNESINQTSKWSNKSRNSPIPNRWYVDHVEQPKSLKQIMFEESAAAESTKRQTNQLRNLKLSSQLKREELHAMYESIPKSLLDEIFAANKYNLEQTMFDLDSIFFEDDFSFTSSSLEPYFQKKSFQNRSQFQNASSSVVDTTKSAIPDRIYTYNDILSDDANLSYEEIRAEANLQRLQVVECQKKSAIATHQKKGALAHYYITQAHEHRKLLREANQRAAAITYKRMNEGRSPNELDLHGLHVDEAIDTLRSVIESSRLEKRPYRPLSVITGRGLNSADGIAKIKKAVLEWLKSKQIRFDIVNDGCIKIYW